LRIFVDECVDWRLARDIAGHEVKTAHEMGWTSLKNGELLARASTQFDVFLTVDRNLSFQQNLPTFHIAVVVLRSGSNRLVDLQRLVPDLLTSLATVKRGAVTYVGV
jgi:predicted nuclease of predicted toxin-antitoxin system